MIEPIAVPRRTALTSLAMACAAWPFPAFAAGTVSGRWPGATLRFLEGLAAENGGYSAGEQIRPHLTPTFSAIACHRLLDAPVPNAEAVRSFVRSHHPGALKKLEQERRIFDFQQIQSLAWLGADVQEYRERIRAITKPVAYLKQYERHGYPVMQSELGVVASRALVGLPLGEIAPAYREYVDQRRRPNGSYNNTPAADGGDGHIMNTLWALRTLRLLEVQPENAAALVEWLQSCQLKNGGFTYAPRPAFAGVDDVAYTAAAVLSLALLGSRPANAQGCIDYLHSLADVDGGCADRRGWIRNPGATHLALEALGSLKAPLPNPTARANRQTAAALTRGLKVFSIQIEAHGRGSPAEAVALAKSLRIHLWGAKNAAAGWIPRAQTLAREQNAEVSFFTSNEEYGTWVDVPGLGTYSHTSDIIAPEVASPSLADKGVVTWPEFRSKRLEPLLNENGRLIWQFGENEELVRLFLDDSVERGGYAAISTFHFGNPDFTNSEPFLHRWRGRIPFIALQDAHGNEPWWFSDMTTGFRTLFLAEAPTWSGWLTALKNNWLAAVRRDAWTGSETWMHAGSDAVRRFVLERESDWRWWDNEKIERPLVSIVPVRANDPFEVGRPESGVALRVRCAWENNPQGLLKQPITELIRLTVNGAEVQPRLVTTKAPRGNLLADHYHRYDLPTGSNASGTATATVRIISTGKELQRTIAF